MSRDKTKLVPELQEKLALVEKYCAKEGVKILVYFTERELTDQATFYRQSRTSKQVDVAKQNLIDRGYDFLAEFFDKTEPCSGKWATNACPGESFHNIAEAFDAVPMLNGVCQWKYKDAPELWDIYGEACRKAGLEWGGDWRSKDLPHAQLISGVSSPLGKYSPDELKDLLTKRGLL